MATSGKIFRITHPNGTSAEVRALKERDARDLLIYSSQDLDWEFAQARVQREEPGESQILWIGQPLIPTSSRPTSPAASVSAL